MMAFPYRILVEWSQEDECFIARVPAFRGLAAHGESLDAATREAQLAAEAMLEELAAQKQAAPQPDTTADFSGNLHVRIPKSLHLRLAREASDEGVSLNQWILAKLAQSPSVPLERIATKPSKQRGIKPKRGKAKVG